MLINTHSCWWRWMMAAARVMVEGHGFCPKSPVFRLAFPFLSVHPCAALWTPRCVSSCPIFIKLSYRGSSLLCLCETVIDFTAGWMNSATSPGCTFLLCVVIRSSCATCFQNRFLLSFVSMILSDCYHFRVSMSVTFWDFCMTGLVSVSHK